MMLAFIKIEGRKEGMRRRSDKVDSICFGMYNKKFKPNRTNSDWLSRDEIQVDKKVNDPACNFIPTLSGFSDMLNGLKYIGKQANVNRINKDLPILLFSGDHDPVGSMGRGVKKVYKSFLKAGCKDVTLKLYPGGRHEMLNETNRQEVYEDIFRWLEAHING